MYKSSEMLYSKGFQNIISLKTNANKDCSAVLKIFVIL